MKVKVNRDIVTVKHLKLLQSEKNKHASCYMRVNRSEAEWLVQSRLISRKDYVEIKFNSLKIHTWQFLQSDCFNLQFLELLAADVEAHIIPELCAKNLQQASPQRLYINSLRC